jgi:hypothetical protein
MKSIEMLSQGLAGICKGYNNPVGETFSALTLWHVSYSLINFLTSNFNPSEKKKKKNLARCIVLSYPA